MKEITLNDLDIKAIFKGSQIEVRLHFRDVLSCLINMLYLNHVAKMKKTKLR